MHVQVLVGDPPAAKLNGPTYNPTGSTYPSQFGLGVGRYGNEIPSPLDAEIQQTILEMQQELAYVDTLPNPEALRHSRRLLKESKEIVFRDPTNTFYFFQDVQNWKVQSIRIG